MYGDRKGNYFSWVAQPGSYELVVKAYTKKNGKGRLLETRVINFKIVKNKRIDSDSDGIFDDVDNCPLNYNPNQEILVWYKDVDNDGYGNKESIISCAPFSFNVLASCHTLLSKGAGKFSITINMCLPANTDIIIFCLFVFFYPY